MLMNTKKRVLVIDDDSAIRELVSDILTSSGYYVIEKSNAEEGIEKLVEKSKSKDAKFDIVICDIMMPGATGFEVLKKIKKSRKLEPPVFIFVTASKERSDLRTAMESGADDFITKPFTPEELLNAVRAQEEKKEKLSEKLRRSLIEESKSTRRGKTSKVKISETQRLNYGDKLFISSYGKSGFVYIRDIILIKSLKDYTKIFTAGDTFVVRKPLKRWLNSLPAENFQMVNRSEIVNLSCISKLVKLPNNTYEIKLNKCSEKVTISRRISIKLKSSIKSI